MPFLRLAALRALFASCLFTAVIGTALATRGDPVGGEFIIDQNSATSDVPVVDVDGMGAAVVAWQGTDTYRFIYYRRYRADGAAIGEPVQVSAGSQPRVAVTKGGNFAIAYSDWDGDGNGVWVKQYASSGALLRTIRVNDTTAGGQGFPAVAMDDNANVYVAWWSDPQDGYRGGIYARRVNSDGTFAGGEVRVNQVTSGDQRSPALAATPSGAVVVAFLTECCQGYGVVAQRLDASLNLTGDPITVSETLVNHSAEQPAVAVDRAGNFVVAYQFGGYQTGDIVARRYAADGTPLTAPFTVNSTTAFQQGMPRVAMDYFGNATIAWTGARQDGSGAVSLFAQSYDPSGAAVGGEALLTSDSLGTGDPYQPASIAMDDDGDLAVVWADAAGDINGARFKGPALIDLGITISDTVDPVAPGGAYRYLVNLWNYYDNSQPYDAGVATGVAADIALPLDVTVNTITGSGWACVLSADNVATCRKPTVIRGPSNQIAIDVTAPVGPPWVEAHASVVSNQDDPNAANDAAMATTTIASDFDPNPFTFADVNPAPRNMQYWSADVTITGINDAAPISVVGGLYRINGGPSTSAAGRISNGERVSVGHTTSSEYATAVSTTLTIGSVSDTFSTTTLADTVPDQFTFIDRTDVPLQTVITSDPVTITGLGAAAPVSVVSGSYSIDGGPFTTTKGTISNGQSVRLQHGSSGAYNGSSSTTLTVGGVQDTFTSTTAQMDQVPDAFTLPDQVNVQRGKEIISAPVTITGINAATPVSATGGLFSIDGGYWMSSGANVRNGQAIRVRHVSSTSFSTTTATTLTVGGVSDTFSSTTEAEDTTPSPFAFIDQVNVARTSLVTSAPITVSGINSPNTPISVTGGTYSVDGGAFTSAPGTVYVGQAVRLQHTAASAYSTTVSTTLTIGGVSDVFTSRTIDDTVPDMFAFQDQVDVPRSTVVTSNPVTITGITGPAPISVSGGRYSIDGGPFTTVAGTVVNGQNVRVQHTSAPTYEGRVSTQLTINYVSDTFTSTVYPLDIAPDPFAFVEQIDVALGADVASNVETITGINGPAVVSVTNGAYSIDGGAWMTAESSVTEGARIQLRHTASTAHGVTSTTTLSIGSASAQFVSRTVHDVTPDAFAFDDVADVPVGTAVESTAAVISGITTPVPISVSGGQYSIDGGAFTSASGTVARGQAVRLRHVSSQGYYAPTTTQVTINGVSASFTSRTVADETPDPFDFVDRVVLLNQPVRSNIVTVSGITPSTTVTVSGGAALILNGANIGPGATARVSDGDTLQLQVTAGTIGSSSTSTVTVGTRSDTWTVTTVLKAY